ncbi:MAG: SAM-dependent chlorinase/fluorinase [Bacteroidota bacterium]
MTAVTLTTDFGLKGYYLAALKGTVLSENPDVQLVDISHHVKPYDIVQGAYILKNAYHHFPKGTIHLISIHNLSALLSMIAFQHDGHYFIGPNNGIFSLLFDPLPNNIYRLPIPKKESFPFNIVCADAVAHISAGKPLLEIGLKESETERRIALQPVISTAQIRGSVIYVDHYENVVVNVQQELFERVRNGRDFQLFFKRHDPITQLSQQYHDVSIGETLCLFNDAGYLTIAINMGKAASLLGLKLDDMVQIDFG